ncbi:hypothetical protein MVEN_02291000 [Mycena venus]|uniref:Uncharacterized protein n=1 Tax=Mycena venus TaxID=2733690 RepID=A0A8H6X5Y0_9AGAR|nr:hypothetical protein MVEN_02291000 [Mycena venus]
MIPLFCSFKGPASSLRSSVARAPSRPSSSRAQSQRNWRRLLGDLAQIAQSDTGVRSLSLTATFPECPKVTSAIAAHWLELHELSLVLKRASRQSALHDYLGFSDRDDSDDGLESGSECDEEILKRAGVPIRAIFSGNWDDVASELGSVYCGVVSRSRRIRVPLTQHWKPSSATSCARSLSTTRAVALVGRPATFYRRISNPFPTCSSLAICTDIPPYYRGELPSARNRSCANHIAHPN